MSLRAPRDVVPGEQLELTVLLDAKKAVDIEWCDVRIEGEQRRGDAKIAVMAPHAVRLCGVRTLPRGTTSLACHATLPWGIPPSYSGVTAHVSYVVTVHASVPWWPDTREHFALHVVAPRGEPLVGVARIGVSAIEGPRLGQPYAELSIPSDVVEVGGVIDGSVSVRNVERAQVVVSLVATETAAHGSQARAGAWQIPVVGTGGGEAVERRFAFRVPERLTPTVALPTFRHEYALVAEARSLFGVVVRAALPIQIVDRGRARSKARLAPPHVGDARLDELFRSAAAQMEGASVEGAAIVVRRGAVVATLTRELGPNGSGLAVRIEYPSLHLELNVHEPGPLGFAPRARSAARQAGLRHSPYLLSSRDERQGVALVSRLSLSNRLAPTEHVRMSDTELDYWMTATFTDGLDGARALAAVEHAIAQLATPPPMPTALDGVANEWLALAGDLWGRLEAGHARIVATTDAAAIEIATLFDDAGEPNATLVSVRPTDELPIHAPVAVPRDGAMAATLPLSPEGRVALARLATHGRVDVAPTGIRVTLDHALGAGIPVAIGRDVVHAALALALALRPAHGPYR